MNQKLETFLQQYRSEQKKCEINGKSIDEILSESDFISRNVNCICGCNVKHEYMAVCSKCQMLSHKECVNNAEDPNFVCPICLFKEELTDPFYDLSRFIDEYNRSVSSAHSLLKRIEDIAKDIKSFVNENEIGTRNKIDSSITNSIRKLMILESEWKEKIAYIKKLNECI